MRRTLMFGLMRGAMVATTVLSVSACQSPTSPSDTASVDDYIITGINPDPATAVPSQGKTYRVVRGNNQPDEILEFDWQTDFSIGITLNDQADDENVGNLDFPVDITSVNVTVQQASGGIVTPPTGGEVEHSEFVVTQSSGSQFASVGSTITMFFHTWYDLPNLRKEALINVAISMADKNGKTTGKTVKVRVSP